MKPIPNGAQDQYVHRVESAHLANSFKNSILPPVFSTPYLILIMENAALNAMKEYLEAGESAVGTRVARIYEAEINLIEPDVLRDSI